jgi:ferredoxin-NADP reductase
VREGTVKAGDKLTLVERKWPRWTIERIQEYLVRDTENLEMMEELAAIEALGEECKGQFRNRVAKAKKKRAPQAAEVWLDMKIVARKMETPRIVSLVLQAQGDHPDKGTSVMGAHAKLKLPNDLVRSYSVVSDDNEDYIFDDKITIGVALDEGSRGGSEYLHKSAKVGDMIKIGRVTNDVKTAGAASNHIFIAGGIGITAFLRMMVLYRTIHWGLRLHYAVRSPEDVPFGERLQVFGDDIAYYHKSNGERMDLRSIIRDRPWNSHIYVCGPSRMMDAAQAAAEEFGVAADEIHYEAFGADISGDPFEVEVANKGGAILQVGEEDSLLEVLRKNYSEVGSSCEVGNCGTCKVTLKSGKVDHRGTALLPEEKQSAMLSCVSRGIGRITIEI